MDVKAVLYCTVGVKAVLQPSGERLNCGNLVLRKLESGDGHEGSSAVQGYNPLYTTTIPLFRGTPIPLYHCMYNKRCSKESTVT